MVKFAFGEIGLNLKERMFNENADIKLGESFAAVELQNQYLITRLLCTPNFRGKNLHVDGATSFHKINLMLPSGEALGRFC